MMTYHNPYWFNDKTREERARAHVEETATLDDPFAAAVLSEDQVLIDWLLENAGSDCLDSLELTPGQIRTSARSFADLLD